MNALGNHCYQNEFVFWEKTHRNYTHDVICVRIRNARNALGISQVEAAKRAGIHEVLWRQYELGTKVPKDEQLSKMADALGVPYELLVPKRVATPEGMLSIYYDLINQLGYVEVKEIDGQTYLKLPNERSAKKACTALQQIQENIKEAYEAEVQSWKDANLTVEDWEEKRAQCVVAMETILKNASSISKDIAAKKEKQITQKQKE